MLNMVEQINERLDQVLSRLEALEKKLEKLETIEVKLQEVNAKVSKWESNVSNLQGDITQLKVKHDETDQLTHKLERSVEFLNGSVEQTDEDLNNLKTQHNLEISSLNRKLLYLEAYSRRENLKFVNIPVELNEEYADGREGVEDTREVLWKFLEEKLHIEDARQIEFQRVHRNGRKNSNKPHPILARFLRFTDREKVRKEAKELKGTNFVIYEDLPKELIDRRRLMLPKLKAAKKQGSRAYFSVSEPDKLYVNGTLVS